MLVCDGVYPNTIGGMQVHSLRLLEELLASNRSVVLVYPFTERDDIPTLFSKEINSRQLVLERIKTKKLFSYPWSYLLNEIRFSRKAWKSIKGRSTAGVYAQGLTALTFPKKECIKLFVNPHGLEPFQQFYRKSVSSIVYRSLFKLLFKKASKVVSLGGNLTKLLKDAGVKDDNIVVIPNGIGAHWIIDEITNKVGSALNCLFVGRDEPRKALPLLLSVCNKFSSEEMTLTVVGPFKKEKRGNVHFIGEVRSEKKLQSIYDQHDVLICPSLAEGMPTVILEAMARGLVVIATDVGATASLVNNSNGILITPNNSNELEEGLKLLLTKELSEMKRNAIKKVRAFTWHKIGLETIELIDNEDRN